MSDDACIGHLRVFALWEHDDDDDVSLFLSAVCDTTKEIPYDVSAWLELDDLPGMTGDDERVYPGDKLNPGDRVRIGNCREW